MQNRFISSLQSNDSNYHASGKSLPSINHGPISNAAKEEVQYIDTNILANYYNKTKLGLQWDFYK